MFWREHNGAHYHHTHLLRELDDAGHKGVLGRSVDVVSTLEDGSDCEDIRGRNLQMFQLCDDFLET